MKNSILNLGKALNKADQKKINGGLSKCSSTSDCPLEFTCILFDSSFGYCQKNGLPIMW